LNHEETQYAIGMQDGSVELRPTENILESDHLLKSIKISDMPIKSLSMFGKGCHILLASIGGTRFEVRNIFMNEVIYESTTESCDDFDQGFVTMLVHSQT